MISKDKIQFKVSSVKYLGNIISAEGVRPDTEKVVAILKMLYSDNKSGTRTLEL